MDIKRSGKAKLKKRIRSAILIAIGLVVVGGITFGVAKLRPADILCNQHHAKPCFAVHHASVSISSLFERKCLDHRADILQDAEGKGILGIDRRASQ